MDGDTSHDLGLDVGSTTVKAVLIPRGSPEPRARVYVRHHGDLRGALRRVFAELPCDDRALHPVFTGSGGRLFAEALRVPLVHEVTALVSAVEARHREVRSVIELGGQDAKYVALDREADGTVTRVEAGMNDRCAAGTGVTLDRCLSRLGLTAADARDWKYEPSRAHALSSKCGVFAETDAVGLARQGVAARDIVISLIDAIVVGALTVLVRGASPSPTTLLLGGPVAALRAFEGALAWHLRHRVRDAASTESVCVPTDAAMYPALGAVDWLRSRNHGDAPGASRAQWLRTLDELVLRAPKDTLDHPFDRYPSTRPISPRAPTNRPMPWTLGVDAGSTATKAVVLDAEGGIVGDVSLESRDPVADARGLFDALATATGRTRQSVEAAIECVGVTGYGAAIVGALLEADAEVLETVAHAHAARAVAPHAEVVCDVGGQDIKVLALGPGGMIRDFKLSNQCSAGIGRVFEATAREFGLGMDQFAAAARRATRVPHVSESCVVFLDSSRVALQRQGYGPDEILAGLARALPRVIWTHVLNGTPPSQLGRVFVLQGGVQRNDVAVQAQREYLTDAVPGAEVLVHPTPHLAGALGAALVAQRQPRSKRSAVVGRRLERAQVVSAAARCQRCPSHCRPSVVALARPGQADEHITLDTGCSAGAAETLAEARQLLRRRRGADDLLGLEARALFASGRSRASSRRTDVRIGIPRALAMYRAAPLFRGYLEHLGVAPSNVVFSPFTSEALGRTTAVPSSSDPCYPVKTLPAHVEYLLANEHRLDALFVPYVLRAVTPVRHARDCASCPVVAAAPSLVRARFSEHARPSRSATPILLDPVIDLTDGASLRSGLFEAFGPLLGIHRAESDAAVQHGLASMRSLDAMLQGRAETILAEVARSHGTKAAVLVLGRPYHADPGLCHFVGEQIQALGYPVLSIRSLPRGDDYLRVSMKQDLAEGRVADPFDVRELVADVDNSGTGERLWAARYAARHGALAVVDVSSFKCAQDSVTFAPIQNLFREHGVVSCSLHDLDETRPTAAMRLRLRTLAHAMQSRGWMPWWS